MVWMRPLKTTTTIQAFQTFWRQTDQDKYAYIVDGAWGKDFGAQPEYWYVENSEPTVMS